MNIMCIGNGASLPQYIDYIVFNNYDIRIGTKLQMAEPLGYELDYIAAADKAPTEYIIKNHPEWVTRTITRPLWRDKFKLDYNVDLLCPATFQHHDVTGTLQIRYAIELGATAITTIAMDSLAGSWKKNNQWEWTSTIDQEIMKKEQLGNKRNKLLNTWATQIKEIEKRHPKIHWTHKHIGNINE